MDLRELLEAPPWDWPSDTAHRLLGVLHDPGTTSAERLIAAELAGNLTVVNDELAIELVSIAASKADAPDLRAKAALSLGHVLEKADFETEDDPAYAPIQRRTFRKLKEQLKKIFLDESEPVEVRRRMLEVSARAPQTWHGKAIREAYQRGERDWMLTAVLCMQWVRGFDNEILAALKSPDPEIQKEAVEAAGRWSMSAAWRQVAHILRDKHAPKRLRLTAIAASPEIRKEEAAALLQELTRSEDREIAEAADEVLLSMVLDSDTYDWDEDDNPSPEPWIH